MMKSRSGPGWDAFSGDTPYLSHAQVHGKHLALTDLCPSNFQGSVPSRSSGFKGLFLEQILLEMAKYSSEIFQKKNRRTSSILSKNRIALFFKNRTFTISNRFSVVDFGLQNAWSNFSQGNVLERSFGHLKILHSFCGSLLPVGLGASGRLAPCDSRPETISFKSVSKARSSSVSHRPSKRVIRNLAAVRGRSADAFHKISGCKDRMKHMSMFTFLIIKLLSSFINLALCLGNWWCRCWILLLRRHCTFANLGENSKRKECTTAQLVDIEPQKC